MENHPKAPPSKEKEARFDNTVHTSKPVDYLPPKHTPLTSSSPCSKLDGLQLDSGFIAIALTALTLDPPSVPRSLPSTRMPESHTTGLGHDASVSVERDSQMGLFVGPSPRQAKHWAKQYRTEIAASSSSVLSTFVAVSLPLSRCYRPLKAAERTLLTQMLVPFRLCQDPDAGVSCLSHV